MIIVGMAGAQAPMRTRCARSTASGVSPGIERAVGGQVAVDHVDDPPGRALMMTMRVESRTASSIEWVTKITVFLVFSQILRSKFLVHVVAGDLVRARRTARPSAIDRDRS